MAAEEPASSWEEAATALPSWQQQQRQAMQPITNQQHVAAGQSQQMRQQSFVSASAASPAEPVWESREQFQMRPKPPAAAAAGSKRKSHTPSRPCSTLPCGPASSSSSLCNDEHYKEGASCDEEAVFADALLLLSRKKAKTD
jgi:hypothetical protein